MIVPFRVMKIRANFSYLNSTCRFAIGKEIRQRPENVAVESFDPFILSVHPYGIEFERHRDKCLGKNLKIFIPMRFQNEKFFWKF